MIDTFCSGLPTNSVWNQPVIKHRIIAHLTK